MQNRKMNQKIRKNGGSTIFLDVHELAPEDNLEQVIRNEDFRYLFFPVNVKKYPENPNKILPRMFGDSSYIKAANPELINLAKYVSEDNKRINNYFGQLAKNFSQSESGNYELFEELEEGYMDSLSRKYSSPYSKKMISEDSIKEATINFIRSYRTDKSNEQGVVLTRESLESEIS
ncbi:MAG: hypothetical protein ABEI74_00500 [Candidatus Pacearchaeota archaeon]